MPREPRPAGASERHTVLGMVAGTERAFIPEDQAGRDRGGERCRGLCGQGTGVDDPSRWDPSPARRMRRTGLHRPSGRRVADECLPDFQLASSQWTGRPADGWPTL